MTFLLRLEHWRVDWREGETNVWSMELEGRERELVGVISEWRGWIWGVERDLEGRT